MKIVQWRLCPQVLAPFVQKESLANLQARGFMKIKSWKSSPNEHLWKIHAANIVVHTVCQYTYYYTMLLTSSIATTAHCRPTAACSSGLIKVWANCPVCVKWIGTNSILSTHHIGKCNETPAEKWHTHQLYTCHHNSYTKSCSYGLHLSKCKKACNTWYRWWAQLHTWYAVYTGGRLELIHTAPMSSAVSTNSSSYWQQFLLTYRSMRHYTYILQ